MVITDFSKPEAKLRAAFLQENPNQRYVEEVTGCCISEVAHAACWCAAVENYRTEGKEANLFSAYEYAGVLRLISEICPALMRGVLPAVSAELVCTAEAGNVCETSKSCFHPMFIPLPSEAHLYKFLM